MLLRPSQVQTSYAANGSCYIHNRGEKTVNVKKVESIFSTNFPFSSDFAFTLFHSGSSWKAF
jgi:hypothetical protein